ncbi:MAG: hypothetical protein V9E89_12590 [Ilumatobacteraceae bacterium]
MFTTVITDGSRSRVACVDPAGDADHGQQVPVPLAAEAVAVQALVGQGQGVEGRLQVADAVVQVHRLHRIAGDVVDNVEHLSQLQQVLEPGPVADAAHAVAVDVVRRAGHRAEGDMAAADAQRTPRVPGVQGELPRHGGDRRRHHLAWEPDTLLGLVHVGPVGPGDAARLGIQELHPDLFEDPQGGVVDGLQLVGGDDLGVVQAHLRLRPRALHREGGTSRCVGAPSAAAAHAFVGHGPTVAVVLRTVVLGTSSLRRPGRGPVR